MADELKIPLIEREIKCLADFKADMTRKFDNRDPAKTTYEFINKTNLEMQKQTDQLSSIVKTLDSHIQEQRDHEREIARKLEESKTLLSENFEKSQEMMVNFIESNDKRVGRLENWKSWVIGIFRFMDLTRPTKVRTGMQGVKKL